jgi:hypothetical protein
MTSAFTNDGFYPFEGPATTGLELIPLSVRHKLDCAQIKLHLTQWQSLSLVERVWLVQQACTHADEVGRYHARLNAMIKHHHGVLATTHPLQGNEGWRELSCWPQVVVDQCENQCVSLPPLARWQAMTEADRHALFVLGRSKHSQEEFVAAMRLFFPG